MHKNLIFCFRINCQFGLNFESKPLQTLYCQRTNYSQVWESLPNFKARQSIESQEYHIFTCFGQVILAIFQFAYFDHITNAF